MRLKLKSYNESAYKKVMAEFEKYRMTCVCHPTGTGKSYIIATVAEHFEKILILAPTSFVLRQQAKLLKWHQGVSYYNFQYLHIHPEIANDGYDLIVIDEFHRAGAPEWSEDVKTLINSLPKAKILGTSATPIRYLDGERNMADELFEGHVASAISITEAWTIYSALPIPRYVSGLFRWDKLADETERRIQNSKVLSEEEKRQRIFRLSNIKIQWELSYGMPAIIRRHLDKDARRVIIFCAHIDALEQMKSDVCKWFHDAGFSVISSYTLHSNMPDREQLEQMQGFESNDGSGIKLMFSVNILNEGIHVPNVNAVMMLRTTSSRIIYMQQMGRCMTAANTEKPLVLDMVDNITTTTAIKELADEFNFLEKSLADDEDREPRTFEITDYTLGIKTLIDKLTEDITISLQDKLKIVLDFVKKYDRLPSHKEANIYKYWRNLYQRHADLPEVKELLKKYRTERNSYEKSIEICEKFFDDFNRPPSQYKEGEKHTSNLYANLKIYHSDDPRVKRMMNTEIEWRSNRKNVKISTSLKLAIYHCENFGKPKNSQKDKYSRAWQYLCRNAADNPEFIELQIKYNSHYHTIDEAFDMIIAECEKRGYQPRRKYNQKVYYMWWHLERTQPNHPKVKYIQEKYPKFNIKN